MAVLAGLPTGFVRAQEATPAATAVLAEAQQLDRITVVGRRDPYAGGQVARDGGLGVLGATDLLTTPFSTLNYTDDFKRNTQAQSLNDVLKYGASVYASNLGSNPRYNNAFIRGFQNYEGASVDGLAGLLNEGTFPIEPFEQVEVILGPTGLLNGRPGNVGGSINLVPKRAGDAPLTRLSTELRSQNTLGVAADVGRRFGADRRFGLRGNLAYAEGDAVVDTADTEDLVASLAFDVRGDDTRASVDVVHHRIDTSGASPQYYAVFLPELTALPEPPRGDRATHPAWLRYDVDTTLALGRVEHDVGAWTLSLAGGARRQDAFQTNYDPALVGSAGDLVPFYANQLVARSDAASLQALARGRFDTGAVAHEVTIGYSDYRSRARESGYLDLVDDLSFFPDSNLFDPVPVPTPEIVRAPLSSEPTARATTAGWFLADRMHLLDDRLHLIAGLRQVRIERRYYDGETGIEVEGGYDDSDISPTFGAAWKLTPDVVLYGNYAEALEPGSIVAPPALNAGRTLPPAPSEQVELGVKAELGGVVATAAAFEIERAYDYFDLERQLQVQDGRQRNRGLEFTAFGAPVAGLRVFGSVSLLDAELVRSGDPALDGSEVTGVPERLASLNLDWDVPGIEGLALQAGAIHVGEGIVNDTNRIALPSWTRYDAGLRVTAPVGARTWTFRFNVENLGNTRAYQIDGAFYVKTLLPRTFLLSASVEL